MRLRSSFILLHVNIRLLKNILFPHWIFLAKSVNCKREDLFLDSEFFSIDLHVCPYTNCLGNCCFVVSFEIEMELFCFVFSNIILAILDPFTFLVVFRVSLSVSLKKSAGILIRTVLSL